MKLTLPENYDEITVRQYREMWAEIQSQHDDTTTTRRVVEILGGLEKGTLNDATYADLDTSAAALRWILDEPDPFVMKMPLKQRIHIDGREYGFIPDWTKLTVGEYADLETFCNKGLFDHLQQAMAIMYRPIVREAFDMYDIESYEPDNARTEAMGKCPMSVCVSAVVFFCNIQKALAITIGRSLSSRRQTEIKERIRSIRNGAGMG